MRNLTLFVPLLLLVAACSSRQYEECNAGNIFFEWGVTDHTERFGYLDSLYYLINPIANIAEGAYYNGDYTDSYYSADSARYTLAYTTTDSILLYIDRMYAVETNPRKLILKVKAEGDTSHNQCSLFMIRDSGNEKLYRCGKDSTFSKFLLEGRPLQITATNASSPSEPTGSQNYEFSLNTIGFMDALSQALGLNPQKKIPLAGRNAQKDSLNNKQDSIVKK